MPDDNVTRAGDKGLKAWQDAEKKRTGNRPVPEQYVQKVLDEEFEKIYTEGTEQHADVYDGWVSKEDVDKQAQKREKDYKVKEEQVAKREEEARNSAAAWQKKLDEAGNIIEQKAEQNVREVRHNYEERTTQVDKREAGVKGREDAYEDELQKAAKAAGVDIRPSLMRDPADDPVKAIVGAIEARQKSLAEQEQKVAKREEQLEAARGILHEVDRLYLRITGKRIEDLPGYSTHQKYTVTGAELKTYEDGLLKRESDIKQGEEKNKKQKDGLLTVAEKLKQKKEQLEKAQAELDSERHDVEEGRASYETGIKELEKERASYDADRLALEKEHRLLDAEREKLDQEKAAAGDLQVNYKEREAELEKRGADLKAAEELNRRKMKNLEAMAAKLKEKEEKFDEKESNVNKTIDSLNLAYADVEQLLAKIRGFVGEVPEADPHVYTTKFFEKVDGLVKYEERLKKQEQDVTGLIEGVKARQAELDAAGKAVTEDRGKLKEAYSALTEQAGRQAQKDKNLKDREQAIRPKEEELKKDEDKLNQEKVEMVERVKVRKKREEEVERREAELKSYQEDVTETLKGIVGEQKDIPSYIKAWEEHVRDCGDDEEELEGREKQVVEREVAVDRANEELKRHEAGVEQKLEDERAAFDRERAELKKERQQLYQQMEEVRGVKAAQAAGTGTTQAKRSTAKAVKQKELTKQVEPEETDRPAKILVMEEPTEEQRPAYEPHDEMVANEAEVKAYMESCGLVEGKDYNFKKGGVQGNITRIHLPTREATEAWKGYMTPPEEEAVEVMEEEPAPNVHKKVAKKPRGKR
jgi:hypothetical protein